MSEWPSIEWEDGYPTDESITAVEVFLRTEPQDRKKAGAFLLRELTECAKHCCASCEVSEWKPQYKGESPKVRIDFSTGGWSGAEQIIGLIKDRLDLRLLMFSWQRGGHYVFDVPT